MVNMAFVSGKVKIKKGNTMKEFKLISEVFGGTCISSPPLVLIDHFYGVCIGIKIK